MTTPTGAQTAVARLATGDVDGAIAALDPVIGVKRALPRLVGQLGPGETVSHLAGAAYHARFGLLAHTDQRLLFVHARRRGEVIRDFPLGRITSVEWRGGGSTGTIVVHAPGGEASLTNVAAHDGEPLIAAVRTQLTWGTAQMTLPGSPDIAGDVADVVDTRPGHAAAAAHQVHPAPASPSAADPYTRLARLWELYETGILTEGEFEDAKQQVLRAGGF